MRTLEDARRDISKIDKKMRKLFIKRMGISKEVGSIKKSLNIPYEDKDREDYLKRKYSKDLVVFYEEYIELLDKVFELSKKIMKENES